MDAGGWGASGVATLGSRVKGADNLSAKLTFLMKELFSALCKF
jgi:hypothetical protein